MMTTSWNDFITNRGGLTGYEITQYMTSIKVEEVHKSIFQGIFMADQIPRVIRTVPALFVVNTDYGDGTGLHWVIIYIPDHNKLIFFDSFGRPPSHFPLLNSHIQDLQNFLLQRRTVKSSKCLSDEFVLIYNTKVLQDYFSDTCGFYVLSCAHALILGLTMSMYLEIFSCTESSTENDQLAIRLVNLWWNKERNFILSRTSLALPIQGSRRSLSFQNNIVCENQGRLIKKTVKKNNNYDENM